jgi:hypothetical protein
MDEVLPETGARSPPTRSTPVHCIAPKVIFIEELIATLLRW